MKHFITILSIAFSLSVFAQEENFVPQYFYLNHQASLLQQHLKQRPNSNPVFQPRFVAVDSVFIEQRLEYLQVVEYEVNQQKLVLYERKKLLKN